MIDFEELDFTATALGDLSLRRRAEVRLSGREVYEVKLGDEFLMSSLFTEGERALAERALDAHGGDALDVAVGGLGLGYTAAAALAHPATASLVVVELLAPVIRWHRQHLVPLGETLTGDPRCLLVNGDFFALAASGEGFDPGRPSRRFDVVLLDIDHSPRHWLSPSNRVFYSAAGLEGVRAQLTNDGVFALWSNDAPDREFLDTLRQAFGVARVEVVEFDNPYSDARATCSVYLAARALR